MNVTSVIKLSSNSVSKEEFNKALFEYDCNNEIETGPHGDEER